MVAPSDADATRPPLVIDEVVEARVGSHLYVRRTDADRLDVANVAANLPFVLRTLVGISALAVGANVIGVIVLALIIAAINSRVTAHQQHVILVVAAILLVGTVVLGVSAATLVQRRTLRWLLRGDRPDDEDARRALRMPRDMAYIAAILWTLGAAVIAVTTALVDLRPATVVAVTGSIVLAGLSSAGVTYLLVERVTGPVAKLALESAPPRSAPVLGVRWRLLLIWLLTSALPILGQILVFTAPAGKTHVIGVSIGVCVVALILGALSTALAARTIGLPLRGLVDALERVGAGDLAVRTPIENAGEIGLLQSGFNDMVAGLRERDRVKDLFGRHVGSAVAQEALRSGVTLSGEVRDVVAVFVDITGSTKRSRETDPGEFVALLNRFYEVVVDEVESNGGLLNKFEGDAALCVFGAPVQLMDPASAALRAARRIRDRVSASAEVEVGVGVAAGPVVAGQVGTESRLEYTVIGDAVNEAARLTELAKDVRQHVLASQAVIDQARDSERSAWHAAGEVMLRGHDLPTCIWTA
ncbi:adenylate/guanylate cyclase domain-containing protein [uncultured Jatrophihabitans sp.]|uniref:adenylate/guanylate cyclase domain-containing protein n=1 Tax=uncultured Jatrophihabitans sp. TaxID=1610747 RepID=UPI0035CC5EF4